MTPQGTEPAGPGPQRMPITKEKTMARLSTLPAPPPAWLPPGEWPLPSRLLHAGDDTIHYTDVGKGPTILFAEAGMWSFIWRDVINQLRAAFRCVALDFRGIGPSRDSGGAGPRPRLRPFPGKGRTAPGRQRSAVPGRATRATGGPDSPSPQPAAARRPSESSALLTRRHGQGAAAGRGWFVPHDFAGPNGIDESAPPSMLGGHRGSRQNWLIWARRALSAPDNRAARIRRSGRFVSWHVRHGQ